MADFATSGLLYVQHETCCIGCHDSLYASILEKQYLSQHGTAVLECPEDIGKFVCDLREVVGEVC
jgi:hypothetical protein